MNRLFRRMQRFGKTFSQGRSQGELANQSDEAFSERTPQDVTGVRAKNQGHKKKTADKWNQ